MAERRERPLKRAETVDGNGVAVELGGYVDESTGEYVAALQDEKFAWTKRKRRTLDMATLYRAAGRADKAERVLTCSTWLQYLATPDGNRQLHHFNACKNRLCPICNKRKARVMAVKLIRVLKAVREKHQDTQLLFLTLTMKNVPGGELRAALDTLTTAWYKLYKRRPVDRAVKGWFRAIEITYNKKQDTYHPHIHAILVVENDYFKRAKGLYIPQAQWVDMWGQCLKADYRPVVGIQSTYGKGKKNGKAMQADLAAAVEAAKYACKDSDFLDASLPKARAAQVLDTYDRALTGKRMTAMGGWVREAAAELELDIEAETDLVHDTEDAGELTSETAALLEDYGWHFGVSDYVLVWRHNNPDFKGGG